MIGKVIVGIVIAIVTGGLVLGAVNRTASRDVESSRFNTEEHEIGSLEVQNGDGYGEGRNGEQGESYGAVTNGNQDDQAGFQSFASNESAGEGLAVDADGWSEVIGIVTSIDFRSASDPAGGQQCDRDQPTSLVVFTGARFFGEYWGSG